jgi:HSP20 family protein
MFYSSLLPRSNSLFDELDRLQRELQPLFGGLSLPTSIRAAARGAFPALNIASTPTTIEIYGFAPGIDPAKLEVTVDRGVLTLEGERATALPAPGEQVSVYAAERFVGSFKRVLALPEDAELGKVEARYQDGILRISLPRRQKAEPVRIQIK